MLYEISVDSSIKGAARKHHIPVSTLRNRLSMIKKAEDCESCGSGNALLELMKKLIWVDV